MTGGLEELGLMDCEMEESGGTLLLGITARP
jgi:hypothetical protein